MMIQWEYVVFMLCCYLIYFLFLWQKFELEDDISIMHNNNVLVVDRNILFPVVLLFNNFYFIFIFELIIAV